MNHKGVKLFIGSKIKYAQISIPETEKSIKISNEFIDVLDEVSQLPAVETMFDDTKCDKNDVKKMTTHGMSNPEMCVKIVCSIAEYFVFRSYCVKTKSLTINPGDLLPALYKFNNKIDNTIISCVMDYCAPDEDDQKAPAKSTAKVTIEKKAKPSIKVEKKAKSIAEKKAKPVAKPATKQTAEKKTKSAGKVETLTSIDDITAINDDDPFGDDYDSN